MTEGLSIQKNMVWNSVGSFVRLGCNYLLTIVVVRLSHGTFDAAGVLSLAMAVANLVNPIADFRLYTIQVTDVDNERSSREYVGLRLLTSFLAFAIGLIYALVTCTFSAIPTIVIYLIFMLIGNFTEVMHAIDQRHHRMDYTGRSYIMQGLSNLGLFSLVLWRTNSLELACAAMALATFAICICYDLPRAATFEPIRPQIDLAAASKTLLQFLPLVIAQICSNAVLTVPRQYLAASFGGAALGIYASVASPAAIVQVGATYIYSPLMGEFADRFNHDVARARALFKKTVLGILLITVAFGLITILCGRWILGFLYGPEIVEYTYLLGPAVLCTFITAFTWFMNDLLLALRDYRASFLGNVCASLVSLALTIPCVRALGMNGVSWVGVIAFVCSVVVLFGFFVHDCHNLESRSK